jgi:hypothetical protein
MRAKLCLGLLACGGLLALGACSKQSEPADAMTRQEAAASPEAAGVAAPAAVAESESESEATKPASPEAQSQLQSAAMAQPDGARKFIRTADVAFRVREVYRSALAIEDLVAEHGGFVARNDIQAHVDGVETRASGDGKLVELATYTVRGQLQVRVPSERAQVFLRALASQVEFLDHRNFAATDAQFELLRQQLAHARHQDAQRLLGEVASGRGKPGERADVVAARSDAQGQRDEALIARRTFEDRVAFATIDLALYQSPQLRRTERLDVDAVVRRDGPGFFSRVGHSLSVGWYGLLDVLVALSRLWPLWLLVVLGVGIVRRWRRAPQG